MLNKKIAVIDAEAANRTTKTRTKPRKQKLQEKNATDEIGKSV
jgi:hypothetical protein